MFSKSNKRCAGKKLALPTELYMLCSSCRERRALKGDLVFFKEGAVAAHKRRG